MKLFKTPRATMLSLSKELIYISLCEGGELFDRLSEEGNFS